MSPIEPQDQYPSQLDYLLPARIVFPPLKIPYARYPVMYSLKSVLSLGLMSLASTAACEPAKPAPGCGEVNVFYTYVWPYIIQIQESYY